MQGMKGGQLPHQLQKTYLERLLRGQERLETGLEELQKSVTMIRSIQHEGPSLQHQVSTVETGVSHSMYAHPTGATVITEALAQSSTPAIDFKTSSIESFNSTLCDGSDSHHAAMEGAEPVLTTSRRQDLDHAASAAGSPFNPRSGHKPHLVFEEFLLLVEQGGYNDENPNLQPCSEEGATMRGQTVELYNGAIGQSTKLVSTGFVIHPASTLSVTCDGLRLVFMLIDMVLVPYVIAWDPYGISWLLYLSCVITAYWSADVLLNFNTGYIQEGKVVLQRCLIAKRYIASTFIIDMCVLCVEYLDLLLTESQSESGSLGSSALLRMLKFFKVARFIRIVTRLRSGLLARMQTSILRWLQVHELLDFLPVVNYAQLVVKVVFLIAILGHVGACVWHLLETVLVRNPGSWQEEPIGEMPQYMRGFYWSLSTMFSGASDLYPLNLGEGILSAVWLVLGMVFVTSITSAMSAAFIEGHVKQQEMTKKLQSLTTYLDQRQTPILLSLAVINEFSRKVFEPKKLSEQDVPLHLINPSLRSSLRDAHFASGFLRLPFFRLLSTLRHGLLQELCFAASEVMVIAGGQEVLTARQEMEQALLLTVGSTLYTKARGRTSFHDTRVGVQNSTFEQCASAQHGEGTWFCELALILNWKAVGTVVSESDCELLVVSTEHFIQVVMNYSNVAVVVSAYSTELSKQLRAGSVKVTDVDPGFDCDAVVSNLPHLIRSNLVSLPVLHIMRKQLLQGAGMFHGAPKKNVSDLEDEVHVGKCHLVIGQEGTTSITRVVRIVVLRLTNKDGFLCVQLGQSRAGACTARFALPGSKCGASESPEDCLSRLLTENLAELAPAIRVVDRDTIVEFESSLSYGIQTKYIKTIFHADLQGTLVHETAGANIVTFSSTLGDRGKHSRGTTSWAMHGFNPARTNKSGIEGSHSEMRLFARWFERMAEGPHHGFACYSKPENGVNHGFVSSEIQKVLVYQWLERSDFDNLYVQRKKVEEELHELFRLQTLESWDRLLGWRLKPDASKENKGPFFMPGDDLAEESQPLALPTSGEASPVQKVSVTDASPMQKISLRRGMSASSFSSAGGGDMLHMLSKKDDTSTAPPASKAHVKTWVA